jgi:hypothetical protein
MMGCSLTPCPRLGRGLYRRGYRMSSEIMEPIATPQQGTLDLDGLLARGAVTQANLVDLLQDADFIQGRTLTKDKDILLGTPFVITEATFRCVAEATTVKGEKVPARDYVSLEYTTISKDPNLCVEAVFNDGSTGVRRQVVSYLQSKGLLDPTKDPDLAIATTLSSDEVSGDVPFALKLVAVRGLRKSDYTKPGTGDATTYYLA